MRCLVAVPLLLLATTAAAQTPTFSIAADLGPAIPLGSFANDGARVGWSSGASAALRIRQPIGVYLSLERTSFPIDAARAATTTGRWTDTGVGAGVRVWLPVAAQSIVQPWIQLGAGLHTTDAPIAGPRFADVDTERIRTLESSGGVDIALGGQRLLLRPNVRYRRYAFSVTSPSQTERSTISSLVLALGLAFVTGPALPSDDLR
jgi:hypothetical protein